MAAMESRIFGALLLVTLGVAYGNWKQEAPRAAEEVVVFEPTRALGVQQLRWTGPEASVVVSVSAHNGDTPVTHVSATRAEALPAEPEVLDEHGHARMPDPVETQAHADDGHGAATPQTRVFPGNDRATELVKAFDPLVAQRRFESPSNETLDEMGFSEVNEQLEVVSGDQALSFDVGASAYGSDNIYLRSREGAVFLVSSNILRPLRRAEQVLMERRPLVIDLRDIVGLRVWTSAGTLDLMQQGRHDRNNAYFARPETPAEHNSAYDGLAEQLVSLRVSSWPAEGAPRPSVIVVATAVVVGERFKGDFSQLPDVERLISTREAPSEGGVLGAIEMGQAVDEHGDTTWYVRSAATGQWASVDATTGADLELLLGEVVGG